MDSQPLHSSASCAPHIIVDDAQPDDMAVVQGIYAWHVLHGLATFEELPPSVEEMERRRQAVLASGLPYLVARQDNTVVGYCYAGLYGARSAYRFCLEDSIYVAQQAMGQGLGHALLQTLIERCERGPWRQMVACYRPQRQRWFHCPACGAWLQAHGFAPVCWLQARPMG